MSRLPLAQHTYNHVQCIPVSSHTYNTIMYMYPPKAPSHTYMYACVLSLQRHPLTRTCMPVSYPSKGTLSHVHVCLCPIPPKAPSHMYNHVHVHVYLYPNSPTLLQSQSRTYKPTWIPECIVLDCADESRQA